MKKVILTIVLGFIGVAMYAQNDANTSQQFKNVTNKPMKPFVLRMTDDMSNDEIGLEFINNFYKIELSDITTNKKVYTIKKQSKHENEVILNAKEDIDTSNNYNIILDLAVRTTDGMRASLYSTEETVA